MTRQAPKGGSVGSRTNGHAELLRDAELQVLRLIETNPKISQREIAEQYMKRLKDLEALALSYDGVEKTYAIQAGRELRVIVASEKVTDQKAEELAFNISQKIQTEMTYPGQVKVTVIRETRATSYAK